MPKINVYLPDALAERVRAANLPISRICQVALAGALGSVDNRIITGEQEALPEPLDLEIPLNNYAVLFVQGAYASARRRGAAEVESGDLLHGLLGEPDALVYRLVERAAGTSADRIRTMLDERLPQGGATGTEPVLSAQARRVLAVAQAEARRTSSPIVHGSHMALGLLDDDGGVAGELLRELDVERIINADVLEVIDEGIAYSRALTPAAPDSWTSSMLLDVASRLDRIEKAIGPS